MAAPRLMIVAFLVLVALARGATAGETPPRNWPVTAAEAERHIFSGAFRVVDVRAAGGGMTAPSRLELEFPATGLSFKVKWKPVPPLTADASNNTVRKEIAAYEIQKFVFDPDDYVVPPTGVRCIPLDDYDPIRPDTTANIYNSDCVLGAVALWLDDVTSGASLWDEQRFHRDPIYARHMADLNLFTYLIEHKDGRENNFLVAKDPENFRVFSVDNGIAFGVWIYNYFLPNWNVIRVPALRKESVDRLRSVTRRDLDSRLAIVAELHRDEAGVLQPVAPGPNLAPMRGARFAERTVQFGLKKSEIDALEWRIGDLLRRVDAGEVATF